MCIYLLFLYIFVVLSAFCFFISAADDARISKRLDRATTHEIKEKLTKSYSSSYLKFLAELGFYIARSGIFSAKTLHQLSHSLKISGIKDKKSLGLYIIAKVILFFFLPVIFYFFLSDFLFNKIFIFFALSTMALIGSMLPDFIVNRRRKIFVENLKLGLADTLDMMIICAEAGLSLEAIFGRVAQEIKTTHRDISEEMSLTIYEMRIGANVQDALTSLGVRTGLESLKRLGSTLVQTIQYGTPLAHALRILSAELRQEQLTRFEEQAARLPVLLTVPMIVFILPCVFLVVGGPAILKVMASFANH